MRLIPLTKGYFTKVDDEDFDRVSKHRWYITPFGYAEGYIRGTGKKQKMHRFIFGNLSSGEVIDHVNGDTLDNTRANLRKCSNSQNQMNRTWKSKSKSGFKGVTYGSKNRWQAMIKKDGKLIYLGFFESKEEAARRYNSAAVELFGEFARLNEV